MLSKIHNHLRSILQVALIAKHSRDDFHATQKPTWIVKFLASFFSVCLLFAFHVFFPSVSFVSFCFFDFDRQSQFFFPGNYQAFRGFMHVPKAIGERAFFQSSLTFRSRFCSPSIAIDSAAISFQRRERQ